MASSVAYRFVDEEPTGYRFVDEPKSDTRNPNAGVAGMANLAANLAGLPMETVKNIANLGVAGFGSAATALGRHDLAPELIERLPGDIENAKGMLRSTKIPLLNPDNPDPKTSVGTFAHDIASRGGFIPGGVLPALFSMAAEKIGGPQWAGPAALLPQAAIKGYNAIRSPGLAREESLNAIRDKTLTDAQDAGYVVPKSAVDPSFLSNRLESIAGKAAVGQEATVRNQKVTNALAREEAGLPENMAISVGALERRRNVLAEPYREAARIDSQVAADIKELKQARFDANSNYRFYDAHPDPEILAKAKKFEAKAEQLESQIETAAKNAGKPDLINELRDARRDIAKTWDVERALNVATGDVSAPILGKMVDRDKPLSGGLSVAGKFQQGFSTYAREGEKSPAAGVSKSEALSSALLGTVGYGTMGPWGAMAAALPLASGPVRSMLLSKPYQKAFVSPSYSPILTEKDIPMLARLGILSQPSRGVLSRE